MTRIEDLVKKLKAMSEEERHELAKYHFERYKERLERKRTEKGL
jgi:hypothetical protein